MAWSDEALRRFQEVARRYDEAFSAVESILAEQSDGRHAQAWVHSLSQQPLVMLEQEHPELAEAERERRAWRVALHTAAELLAWHTTGKSGLPEGPSLAGLFERTPNDESVRRSLDRFVTTLDYAKEGHCHYVDGQFLPGGSTDWGAWEDFEDEITGLYQSLDED